MGWSHLRCAPNAIFWVPQPQVSYARGHCTWWSWIHTERGLWCARGVLPHSSFHKREETAVCHGSGIFSQTVICAQWDWKNHWPAKKSLHVSAIPPTSKNQFCASANIAYRYFQDSKRPPSHLADKETCWWSWWIITGSHWQNRPCLCSSGEHGSRSVSYLIMDTMCQYHFMIINLMSFTWPTGIVCKNKSAAQTASEKLKKLKNDA